MPAQPLLGRWVASSRPGFIEYPRPRPDSPNVVVVVLDDIGFGRLGCFGGDIDIPNIDPLADRNGQLLSELTYDSLHLNGEGHRNGSRSYLPRSTDSPETYPLGQP